MLSRPSTTCRPPTTSTSPEPMASTTSATGDQRASVAMARWLMSRSASLRALERRAGPAARGRTPARRGRCGSGRSRWRRTGRTRHGRPAARARTLRRCRIAKTSSTGTTASATRARAGLTTARMASTTTSRIASGSRVEDIATSASSRRPTSVVSRETSSPERIRSCQRSDSSIARSKMRWRSRAPMRSAARSADTTAAMSTSPDTAVSRTTAMPAAISSALGDRPRKVRPAMA